MTAESWFIVVSYHTASAASYDFHIFSLPMQGYPPHDLLSWSTLSCQATRVNGVNGIGLMVHPMERCALPE